jgi:bifunctional UDP-N-acetylglucosamine pyrophosphorylase/glucosamine-1-phosphate N-acetyltransferase
MKELSIEAIVLAAGMGTRMKSELPKVLHKVCGVPMIEHLLAALQLALRDRPGSSINMVVGHKKNLVTDEVMQIVKRLQFTVPIRFTNQDEQLGTGHAVKLALENKSPQVSDLVAVFNGDLPLFTAQAFTEFLTAHIGYRSQASLMSFDASQPTGYGRILRKGKNFIGSVEEKEASATQKRIQEVNGGVYLFGRPLLEKALAALKNKNNSGEYYLPDVFKYAAKSKKKILAHKVQDPRVLLGVNNLFEIATAERELYQKISAAHMVAGVRILDPATAYIGPQVKIGSGSVIAQGVILSGNTVLENGVTVGPYAVLSDTYVAAGAEIKAGTVAESSRVGAKAVVGPMARLRPGTVLEDQVKIGNFVEIKESTIGSKTSVSHLSYVGDAQIGKRVNIGCGFVTCNYDGLEREGRRKHRSIIGDDCFIGSDSQVVAPIQVAEGTFVASGSTVTESVVEPHSLVVARTRQVTKPGYALRYKQKK